MIRFNEDDEDDEDDDDCDDNCDHDGVLDFELLDYIEDNNLQVDQGVSVV